MAHWQEVSSTHPLERLNGGIRRGTDLVGVLPNPAVLLRLADAVLVEPTRSDRSPTAATWSGLRGPPTDPSNGSEGVAQSALIALQSNPHNLPEAARYNTRGDVTPALAADETVRQSTSLNHSVDGPAPGTPTRLEFDHGDATESDPGIRAARGGIPAKTSATGPLGATQACGARPPPGDRRRQP